MKKCLILIVSFFLVLQLKANDFSLEMKKPDVFNHLDVALTLGTTGIGFDLATPIYKDLLQLRAGYAFMPGFRQTLTFGVDNYTKDGTIVSGKKQQISELMKKFTGYDVDYEVDMQGTLVADPVENQGYALGSEVLFNNGLSVYTAPPSPMVI